MKYKPEPKHTDWLHTLHCIACGAGNVIVHHLLHVPPESQPDEAKERRGMSLRHSDRWGVPMCQEPCHAGLHLRAKRGPDQGHRETAWFAEHGIYDAPAVAAFLWANSLDSQAAYDVIEQRRQPA